MVSRVFRAFDPISRNTSFVDPVNNGCLPREEECKPEKQEAFSSYTQIASAKAESTFQDSLVDFDPHQSPFPSYDNKETNRNVSSPLVAPITTLDMNITTEQIPVGFEELLIWTTIEVSAKISAECRAKMQMPLDIVILLDNAYVVSTLKDHWFDLLTTFSFQAWITC